MRYLSLFENWKESFMTRYDKALKLSELGLLDSPLSPVSPVWEDFKRIIADRLEEQGFRIEDLFTQVTDNRSVLEISHTQQLESGATDTRYLRFMLIWKQGEKHEVYLVGPDFLEGMPNGQPLHIIDEIVRISNKWLKHLTESLVN